MIDLQKISAVLDEPRAARFRDAVAKLEDAVKSGVVPNAVFVVAKETINRRVEEAAEAFLATGPHEKKHHQSDWWLAAHSANAFVSGAHGVPSALKRARKISVLSVYADFIEGELLPLANLLAAAKPLIRKRQPGDKTPKQIEADAERMKHAKTCQCCGRAIFAETGAIAHHGYERPGDGWQTASCMGARELPFEVSRDRLGDMIAMLEGDHARITERRAKVEAEEVQIIVSQNDYSQPADAFGRRPTIDTPVDRETFAGLKAGNLKKAFRSQSIESFDDLKKRELDRIDHRLVNLAAVINEQKNRFDGWKQTHEWRDGAWVKLSGAGNA